MRLTPCILFLSLSVLLLGGAHASPDRLVAPDALRDRHRSIRTDGSVEIGRGARLETQSVMRGTRELIGAARVSKRGEAILIARGAVREEIQPKGRDLEQSWTFESEPQGFGDVTVRVHVEGLSLRDARDGALAFVDREGGPVHYGAGTWVDARGERTPIPARFDGEAIALTVPASVVESSRYPAVLDPTISAELDAGPVTTGIAHGDKGVPSVAFDGTSYVVAWADSRLPDRAYAARFSTAGVLLDPVGFPISDRRPCTSPSLASSGTESLAVWTGGQSVWGARISKTGGRLDSQDLLLANVPAYCDVKVAFNGTDYLVVWNTKVGLHSLRVSPAGKPLDPIPKLLVTRPSANDLYTPETFAMRGLACGTTMCLLAYVHDASSWGPRLRAVRIDATGSPIDATPPYIAGSTGEDGAAAAVAAGNNEFLVGSTARIISAMGVTTIRVRLTRVTPTTATALPTDLPGPFAGIAFDGTAYKVAGAGVSRVASDGTVLNTPIATSAQGAACTTGNCLVAFSSSSGIGQPMRVAGSRISTDHALLDPSPVLLSASAEKQQMAQAVSSGSAGLLLWQGEDTRKNESGGPFRGARIDPSGVLDATPIDLAGTRGYHARMLAASDGTNVLLVWETEPTASITSLVGRRFAASGAALDAQPFTIMQSAGSNGRAYMVFDGTNFFVTWFGVGTTHVTPAGTVLEAPPLPPPSLPIDAIASNGSTILVAWSNQTSPNQFDIYGARLNPTGQPIDVQPLTISTAPGTQTDPAIASDGSDFLVVWSDQRNAIADNGPDHIYGTRVLASGVVLDPGGFPIAQNPIGSYLVNRNPALAYSSAAKRYLVAWTKNRDESYMDVQANGDIWGAEVDLMGKVAAGSPFPIAASESDGEWGVSVAPLAGSRMLVAFSHLDTKPPYGSVRARARIVDLDGNPAAAPDAGRATTPPGSGAPATTGAAERAQPQLESMPAEQSGGESGCAVHNARTRGGSGIVAISAAAMARAILRRRTRCSRCRGVGCS